MAHEVDGKGKVKVFEFTVSYDNGEASKKKFTDYSAGWDWARAMVDDWKSIDAENNAKIDYEYEWIDENALESEVV